MIDINDLEAMSCQSIEAVSPERLIPLSDVRVNNNTTGEEKVLTFIKQIGNPYCFLSGGTPVRVRFTENGRSMAQALEGILRAARQE